MPGLVAGDVLDEHDGGVDVEFLPHGDVEGGVSGAGDGGVKDPLEPDFVAFEGGDGFAEELFLVFVAGFHAADVDLFPFDGDVVGFEDLADRVGDLGADAIAWGKVC